jgi:single-stranded-DNA-specific exonuclease
VDLVITDHHNLPREEEGLPDAFAIVHPKRPGAAAYPFPHLSGAGVAYKLAWRVLTMRAGASKLSPPERELLLSLLAFAALGTIADVVPLVGENRVLARFGLGRVKCSPFEGLQALVEASGLGGQNVDSEHAGFALGPRLNAAGRMGHAREAVELFTTATGPRATEIARNLSRLNDERRTTEARIAEQAAELAHASGMTGPDRRAIVLAHEEWHQGVVGIVCSRLVERFCRPTILMQTRDGRCCGSGRSVRGFSLHAALERCAGRLVRFGGHDMAAGVEMEIAELPAFTEEFIAHANGALGEDDLVARLSIDCDAGLAEMTGEAVERLERLAPFGMENPRPRIRVCRLKLTSRPAPLGAGGKHIALTVTQDGRGMRMVGWNWAQRAAGIPAGVEIDAVVSPKLSRWNGRVSVEPEIVDLRVRP